MGMQKNQKRVRGLVVASLVAALYALLTVCLWEFSSLGIQFRISEALTVLPAFTFSAVPGLTVGCFIANFLSGQVLDAVFGSLATLAGALLTYGLRKHWNGKKIWLLPLPNILANTVAVPLILYYGYGFSDFLGYTAAPAVLGLYALSVLIGETAVGYLLGLPLYRVLSKHNVI